MVQAILELFASEQKAAAMLANPLIEFIFIILFLTFVVTLLIHLILFIKLKRIQTYLKETDRMDIEPLSLFKEQFTKVQATENVDVETFVQEKFSGWRLFQIPVINVIKLVQMTVSMFILIGVLGTFIGLTISLGSIHSGSEQLVENVASVLSGIDVAFYTSIFGMGFSLIMTVLVKVCNTEYILTDTMLMVESKLSKEDLHGMGQLIDVSQAIHSSIVDLKETNEHSLQSIVTSFAGFKDYTSELQQSAKDLAAFNKGLASNLREFQELFVHMKRVTDGFNEGTVVLNENFAALFAYFEGTDQRNERIVTTFEKTAEQIDDVSQTQIKTLHSFDESMNELRSFTGSLLEDQEHLTKNSADLVETMRTHNAEFKRIFGDHLSADLRGMTAYLGELAKGFETLGNSVTQLPEALEVINETQAQYKHLLTDRFRELKEFNESFQRHLNDHTKESATFEQQMRQAVMTYEQMGRKNNEFIREINTMITNMDRGFSQREQELEMSVTALKDTLATYVSNVEGTLNNKLDDVVRQLGHSMTLLTDGMQRELTDMHRFNEHAQKDQAESLRQLIQQLGREIHTLNRHLQAMTQRPTPVNREIGWDDYES